MQRSPTPQPRRARRGARQDHREEIRTGARVGPATQSARSARREPRRSGAIKKAIRRRESLAQRFRDLSLRRLPMNPIHNPTIQDIANSDGAGTSTIWKTTSCSSGGSRRVQHVRIGACQEGSELGRAAGAWPPAELPPTPLQAPTSRRLLRVTSSHRPMWVEDYVDAPVGPPNPWHATTPHGVRVASQAAKSSGR